MSASDEHKVRVAKFAIENAGQIAYVTAEIAASWKHASIEEGMAVGIIVGYRDGILYISPEGADPKIQAAFGITNWHSKMIVVAEPASRDAGLYQFYSYEGCLVVKPKPIKVKPYPSTCRLCKAPAKKLNKSIVICSNGRCKSRMKIRSAYKFKVPKLIDVDAEGYVICPECGDGKYVVIERRGDMRCGEQHRWTVRLRDGLKLNRIPHCYVYNESRDRWEYV